MRPHDLRHVRRPDRHGHLPIRLLPGRQRIVANILLHAMRPEVGRHVPGRTVRLPLRRNKRYRCRRTSHPANGSPLHNRPHRRYHHNHDAMDGSRRPIHRLRHHPRGRRRPGRRATSRDRTPLRQSLPRPAQHSLTTTTPPARHASTGAALFYARTTSTQTESPRFAGGYPFRAWRSFDHADLLVVSPPGKQPSQAHVQPTPPRAHTHDKT